MNRLIKSYLLNAVLCLSWISILACSADKEATPDNPGPIAKILTANVEKIDFQSTASTSEFIVTANATNWSVAASEASWLTFTPVTGLSGRTTITVTASENTASAVRTAVITISSSEVASVKVTVSQAGKSGIYPSYNTAPIAADATGMSSTAVQLATKIKLGWNIGNTMEATGSETAWGNPKVTKALIDAVKAKGFNAIRIPCSWNQYLENTATAKIKADWFSYFV